MGEFSKTLGITNDLFITNKIWATGEYLGARSQAEQQFEQSLKRLSRDHLDAMQVHTPVNVDIILPSVFNSTLDTRLAQLQISPTVQQLLAPERIKLAGAQIPSGLDKTVSTMLRSAIAESFISSFQGVMVIAAGLAIASALTAVLMIQPQRSNPSRFQASAHPKRNL